MHKYCDCPDCWHEYGISIMSPFPPPKLKKLTAYPDGSRVQVKKLNTKFYNQVGTVKGYENNMVLVLLDEMPNDVWEHGCFFFEEDELAIEPLHETDLNVGRKDDQTKKRWSLVQFKALEQYVDILELGAQKYGDHNWRLVMAKEDGKDRYFNALMRHIIAWKNGELNDPESGLSHLAHVICNTAFLLETEIEETK